MTDTIRNEYLRLHNFRRSLLAKGEIPRKDGKLLPKAANMWRMKYACDLEEGAILHASQCPTLGSEASSRPGVGENFKTFPAARFTFDTAPKKAVTEWWKTIRDVNYFENVVVFRPFHDQAPISTFTQMGWATTNELGCSIVKCTMNAVYVGVCRYRPKGNIVNSNVYEVGAPCSRNPGGATSCDNLEGLWFN
ncbi:SCP-like protein [Ancylostoma duodenale]|uniref:SCP-like protein n=1 Tax=Ancylostoma duodenale TaxID=51022 RepID=A0A0C2GFN5_9BILA|nr:SCP-like protein [Ancylostoma duodenale]